jgi:hypothetical protein
MSWMTAPAGTGVGLTASAKGFMSKFSTSSLCVYDQVHYYSNQVHLVIHGLLTVKAKEALSTVVSSARHIRRAVERVHLDSTFSWCRGPL